VIKKRTTYPEDEAKKTGTQPSGDEDHAIIRRVLDGSVGDFEQLIIKYQSPVYNLLFRMLKNRYEAEEFTQAAFIQAYEALPAFRFEFRFFSWLYRIAVNSALNHLKQRKRFTGIDQIRNADREIKEDHQEKSEHLHWAIGLLKEKYQTLIILKYYRELSYREIAFILETEEKRVRSRLYDARVQLKEILERTEYYG
jgi:RNA polymerase sigma-70 factor, ECF subfamily